MNRMFCTNPEKRVFDNERAAKHAARMSKNKKAYKCLCGGWHLTSDQTRTKSRYRFSKERR